MRNREELLQMVERYRQLASEAASEAAASQYAAWRAACSNIAEHWLELADDIEAMSDLRSDGITQGG
jgi:hypothetical protein